MNTLYLCYFGIREPLVQAQVLPYLRQLYRAGLGVNLLTFEPLLRRRWTPRRLAEQRAALAADGISWFCLPYHKRPTLPATLYDIGRGAWWTFRFARARGIDVLHGRSTLPALMALPGRRWARCELIFDLRGLVAEEYVDAGLWAAGSPTFRAFKWVERLGLRRAAQVVVVTERVREWLVAQGVKEADRIEVIPCCVDFARFAGAGPAARQETRRELGAEGRYVIAYLGSLVGIYMTDEMARFLALARRCHPEAFALILTQSPPAEMAEKLRAHGFGERDFLVRRVEPAEVPRYLSAADVSLSFIKPTFSRLASSPTKTAEALACGLPLVCNSGIGDLDGLIERERVGVLVREFTDEAFNKALAAVDELRRDASLAERCRACARARFDLESVGGPRYCGVYRRVGAQRPRDGAGAREREGRPRASNPRGLPSWLRHLF